MAEMVPTPPLSRNTRAAYLLADRIAQRRRYRAFALVNTAMLTMQETNRIMQSTAEDRRTTHWHQHLTGSRSSSGATASSRPTTSNKSAISKSEPG
jgi:hypothetical protein